MHVACLHDPRSRRAWLCALSWASLHIAVLEVGRSDGHGRNTTHAWWCCDMLVASPLSNHWIRWVKAMTAANGPAEIRAAARCPATHWNRTSSANCPCSATLGHGLGREEVYPRRAKAVIGDIRGSHAVAVALQHGCDSAGAAAWLPHSPPKLHMTK
jgi:hypothetical protein